MPHCPPDARPRAGQHRWPPRRGNAVTGTITFDGDPTIPAGAVLTVALREVSYRDTPAELISSQTLESRERIPIDFAVPDKPDKIDPRAT